MDSAEDAGQLGELYAALGDHLAGGRPDGIFVARRGGPGSAPDLEDLAPAEWHVDLLPFPPTAEQRAALAGLGYTLADERPGELRFRRPAALDVVLLSHELGVSHEQQLIWAYLRVPGEERARASYRKTFLARGRGAADATLLPEAQTWQVARTRFGPLERAAALLGRLAVPWMFAAGWALDLHRQAVTGAGPSRPHEDVDVIVGREHQRAVGRALVDAGYRAFGVQDGTYVSWEEPLKPPHFQLHAHRDGREMLDVMLTDLSDDCWHFRRDPGVTLPLAQARCVSALGLPYLAPQAVLLFKAGAPDRVVRPKDERDFAAVLPALAPDARAWLVTHLAAEHGWQSLLEHLS